jgi:acyl-CoA synthetase (AMP-forming)/AMP-acid ligase II
MTSVMTERDGAGRILPAPVIPDLTLPQFVLGSAFRRGSKSALVDAATGQEVSYADLADAVREIGAGLSARGLRPGDVLALCAQNCIEFAVAWFAAASIGAIVTTVNPQCTGDEIARQLRQSLATAAAADDYDLASLRLLTSAAAPLGADLARTCAQRLGCRVKQAYGMTEVSGGTHIAPDAGPDRPDSIGPALPGAGAG